MATKPPIRDSSITEQQLAPHLRRRIAGGGRTYSSSVTTTTTLTTLAVYTGAGGSADVLMWDWASTALAAATVVVSSTEVTDTDPWTFQASSDRTVVVTLEATISAGCGTATLALLRDGVDVAIGSSPIRWTGQLATGSALTIEARAHAGASDVVLMVSDVTVTVTAAS